MKNRIVGVIGILFGGGILVSHFLRETPASGGAYGGGQIAGLVFGGVMLLAGIYYTTTGGG